MLRAGRQPERLGLVEELGWTPRVAALLVKPWRVAAHAVAFQDAIGDHSGLVGDQDLGFAVGERRQQRGAAELVTAACTGEGRNNVECIAVSSGRESNSPLSSTVSFDNPQFW